MWSDLLASLAVRQVSASEGGSAVFEGQNLPLDYHRIYGGQILGQFMQAANAVHPDKSVKSIQTLFAKEGHTSEPVRYEVTTHHAGRAFATVSVVARQTDRVVATASISLHAAEEGPIVQTVPAVPALPSAEHKVEFSLIPWETRATTSLDDPAAGAPEYELWMRTPEVDPALAPALTAFATDLNLIGTALRPIDGVTQADSQKKFASAVTSHSLWFHRPFRSDVWLLLRQHSPLLAHSRAFGRGDVLTEDGSLVASYAQEALVRFK
ncbi:acyl-CoA thioesterase II [Nocardia sp. BMG111209]|uniref:acyl-CoA thioesterase n=1 Tax=Nocardia sp. BMG111209 TaxID=1160137 RepID=UPI00035F2732|nr:acyl-CoA thioesterase domain-containing protein [Nocardia sp. BMG111209]